MSSNLLDVASDGAIASSVQEATALLTERDTVAAMTQGEALSLEPAELDDIAETLESTGALARSLRKTLRENGTSPVIPGRRNRKRAIRYATPL
ncbi:MAG: hypothetical protein K2Y20_13130 [Sphingomonas sp.]|nr:hypothetical protein [Sphingomonas sp.]